MDEIRKGMTEDRRPVRRPSPWSFTLSLPPVLFFLINWLYGGRSLKWESESRLGCNLNRTLGPGLKV